MNVAIFTSRKATRFRLAMEQYEDFRNSVKLVYTDDPETYEIMCKDRHIFLNVQPFGNRNFVVAYYYFIKSSSRYLGRVQSSSSTISSSALTWWRILSMSGKMLSWKSMAFSR